MENDNITTTHSAGSGLLHRLYAWVISWAGSRFAVPALFVLAFAESSFFPIPPDPLVLALGVAKPKRAIYYAFVCTVASVLGGMAGYAIGHYLIDSIGMKIIELYGLLSKYDTIALWYEEYNAAVVLVAGISPIPYKVFTIAAGAFKVDLFTFVLASVAGRGFRFFAEGILIYYYGQPIRGFIEKYLALVSWGVAILTVAGFVAVKFLLS